MDSDLFESIFNLVKDLRATVMEAGATYYPRNNADAFPSVPYLLRFLDSVMPWLATQASAFVQATTAEGKRIHDVYQSICEEPPLLRPGATRRSLCEAAKKSVVAKENVKLPDPLPTKLEHMILGNV